MGATIQQDNNGIWTVRVSDALRKEELDGVQAAAIAALAPHDEARLLVMVAEGFRGWVGTEEWNDMSFFSSHGDRIVKIAIVGDPRWETKMLMFTGAGLRRAPVRFFATDELPAAYDWLSA
jgi:hypothetical protein